MNSKINQKACLVHFLIHLLVNRKKKLIFKCTIIIISQQGSLFGGKGFNGSSTQSSNSNVSQGVFGQLQKS